MMKYFLAILTLLLSSSLFSTPYEVIPDHCSLKILTPSLQERKTAKIRLKNGLEAYLISDPNATKSAAALSMGVGSWSDAKNYPGIAHFTEHLLFMGSEKYPDETSYHRLVVEHGGQLNAFTAPDATVYGFSINHDTFPKALDMFAHLFIDPLFKASAIERELHAVDQEHAKNIENDRWRNYAVEKATGNPNHPHAKFSTGNRSTLEEIPRSAVIKWWSDHYSADRAHLVFYSSLPIDKLTQLANDLFSSLPQTAHSKLFLDQKMSSKKNEGKLIAIEPIKEASFLTIKWELPKSIASDLTNSAPLLIASALESRHKDGLYDQLKQELLIETLSAGIDHYSKENAFFELTLCLTPKGATQFETVIKRCYQALSLLKANSLPYHLFNEIKTMSTLNYAYQSQQDPFGYVLNTAYALKREPLDTFPEKLAVPTTFDTFKNRAFLKLLTPQSASYYLMAPSKLTSIPPDQKEQWYGVNYAIRPIDPIKLDMWKKTTPQREITLRAKNPFLPKQLSLVTPEKPLTGLPSLAPIIQDKTTTAYFWNDTHYRTPEVIWEFRIKSNAYQATLKSAVLGDLFLAALDDLFPLLFAYASPAGLSFSCYFEDLDFIINLNGYSARALDMLTVAFQQLTHVEIDHAHFDKLHNRLSTDYANFTKELPLTQARAIANDLLLNCNFRAQDKQEVLATLTYDDFTLFTNTFFDQTAMRALLIGNLNRETALEAIETVQTKLSSTPLTAHNRSKKEVMLLPKEKGPYQLIETTASLGNAALLILQHGASSLEKSAAAAVLQTALSQDFFDTLRTKQQTAYIARAQISEINEVLHTALKVQSATHRGEELIHRFELFLENYVKDFTSIFPKERFEQIKRNLIIKWETLPPNLTALFNQLEVLAFEKSGNFKRIEQLTAALKTLTYEQLKGYTKTFFSRQNSKRIAILLNSTTPTQDTFRYTQVTAEEFKSTLFKKRDQESLEEQFSQKQ